MDSILEVNNLRKSYGEKEILKGITFAIQNGEICGLVGNNGEGKTTILRIVLGLMKQTSGEIKWRKKKEIVGYMPQVCKFNDQQTVKQTIHYFAELHRCSDKAAIQMCDQFKLDTAKRVKILSPGQQKKLQLILATLGEPELYVLDEPTAGLDPGSTLEVLHMIKEVRRHGSTILISSHILEDLNEICTQVLILKDGRLTSNSSVSQVTRIRIKEIKEEQYAHLKEKYRISINEQKNELEFYHEEPEIPDIVRDLVQMELKIYEISYGNLKNVVLNAIED